jgi:transcriptional regulator with XRE-family HTH domain
MTIGEAVRELRCRLNLTQQQLAFETGLAMRTISQYETGDTPGSLEVLERFMVLAEQHDFWDIAKALSRYPSSSRLEEAQQESIEMMNDLIAQCRKAMRRLPAGDEKKQAIAAFEAVVTHERAMRFATDIYEDRRKWRKYERNDNKT